MPQVSIVIVNWNGRHFLDECLSSIQAQSFQDYEVIVVDNHSTDDSVPYIREHFAQVRVIGLVRNEGFCRGNNVGIEAARGEYIALLNNDVRLDPAWLQEMVATLQRHPEVGFCASKMLFYDQVEVIDTAGDMFYAVGFGAKRGHGEASSRFAQEEYVFGACAGAAIYRKSMLDQIGLFDEAFFAYDEDIDLSFRAQLQGYKCSFVPTAIVYHHGAGTSKQILDIVFVTSRRNMVYVLIKNMPARLIAKNFFGILGYFMLSDMYWILSGKWRSVLRCRMDNIRNLARMLQKRKRIQGRRAVSNSYIQSLFVHESLGQVLRRKTKTLNANQRVLKMRWHERKS